MKKLFTTIQSIIAFNLTIRIYMYFFMVLFGLITFPEAVVGYCYLMIAYYVCELLIVGYDKTRFWLSIYKVKRNLKNVGV